MNPFFIDLILHRSETPTPMFSRGIRAIGVGYLDTSNDFVVDAMVDDGSGKRWLDQTLRDLCNRMHSVGGTPVGKARVPMLGIQLVGWSVRSKTWPRLAFELFKADLPVYNLAAPLSKKWHDVDMADLRNVMSQANYIDEADNMEFDEFARLLGYDIPELEPHNESEYMKKRIEATCNIYAKYLDFSGKS